MKSEKILLLILRNYLNIKLCLKWILDVNSMKLYSDGIIEIYRLKISFQIKIKNSFFVGRKLQEVLPKFLSSFKKI